MVTPGCTNGCSVPEWKCVRCANVTAALTDLDLPPRGNLLILSLPGVEVFRSDEFSALDRWVRRGNTLLINAALLDQPDWAAGRAAGAVVEIESLTAIEFETRKGRESRLDRHAAGATRARSGCARPPKDEDDEEDEDPKIEASTRIAANYSTIPGKIALTATGPHVLLEGVKTLELVTDYTARRMVAAHAVRQLRAHAGAHRRRRGRAVRTARG